MPGPPPAEVDVDEAFVRRLLATQHPDLAHLPMAFVAEGFDNFTWRLGDDLAARLPRREASVVLVAHEQRWLPELAPHLPVTIPEPVRVGEPGDGYPWPWSVVRWVEGTSVAHVPLAAEAAGDLGRFLAALHSLPVPDDAPHNPYRGVPLRDRAEATRGWMDQLDLPEVDEIQACWEAALDVPIDRDRAWVHGDLHPKNLVGNGGRLTGVVDWGDVSGGDPATDLASVWMLFPLEVHADVWAAYGPVSGATRARARGWAVAYATMLVVSAESESDPFWAIGRATLQRALADS